MPEAHNAAAVANRLGALALRLGDDLRDATEAASGMAGVLPAALVSLHEWAGGASVDVLADALRVTHSRAVRVVDQLSHAGLASRDRDGEDARRVQVSLTPRGRRLARRTVEARGRAMASAIAALDGPQLEALEQALGTMLDVGTVDISAARQACRMCDAVACGHHEGRCPVTRGADRIRPR